MVAIRELILHIAQLVTDLDGTLGVTRLVKLLYLIDVEFYRQYQRKLTDLNWVFYKYGPYAFEIEGHLRSLDLELAEEDISLSGGRVFRSLKSLSGDVDVEPIGGERARLAVDRIVRDWALEDLNALLAHVYFETEPMRNPVLGQPLDFNLIERTRLERYLDEKALQFSDDEAADFRQKLQKFRKRRDAERSESQNQRKMIHSAPDRVYDQVRRMMQDDDTLILPPNANVFVEESEESPE